MSKLCGKRGVLPVVLMALVSTAGCQSTGTRVRVADDAAAPLLAMERALMPVDAFILEARDGWEESLEGGATRWVEAQYRIAVRRSGQMRIVGQLDGNELSLWYNAGDLVLHDREKGLYARAEVEETLEAFLDQLLEVGYPLPAHDFLYQDVLASLLTEDVAVFHVGKADIAGQRSDHLLCMMPSAQWELWVSDEVPAVPTRLLFSELVEESSKTYDLMMQKWMLDPEASALGSFSPTVPEGARRVGLLELMKMWEAKQ